MTYYELQYCSGPLPNIWTSTDLYSFGVQIGLPFISVQHPGSCLTLVSVTEVVPPAVEPITPNSSNFVNCTACLNSNPGCTDPIACNYDPCATIDDGSCFYNNVTIRILCNDPITACDTNSNCD